MPDKTRWDIEQLKKSEEIMKKENKNLSERVTVEVKDLDARITSEVKEVNSNFSRELRALDKRIDEEIKVITAQMSDFHVFKLEILQKISVAFHKIDDLRASDTFIKRTFTTALVGGVFSAVISFLLWFMG